MPTIKTLQNFSTTIETTPSMQVRLSRDKIVASPESSYVPENDRLASLLVFPWSLSYSPHLTALLMRFSNPNYPVSMKSWLSVAQTSWRTPTELEEVIQNALKHGRPTTFSLTCKRSTCTFEAQADDVWPTSSGKGRCEAKTRESDDRLTSS